MGKFKLQATTSLIHIRPLQEFLSTVLGLAGAAELTVLHNRLCGLNLSSARLCYDGGSFKHVERRPKVLLLFVCWKCTCISLDAECNGPLSKDSDRSVLQSANNCFSNAFEHKCSQCIHRCTELIFLIFHFYGPGKKVIRVARHAMCSYRH